MHRSSILLNRFNSWLRAPAAFSQEGRILYSSLPFLPFAPGFTYSSFTLSALSSFLPFSISPPSLHFPVSPPRKLGEGCVVQPQNVFGAFWRLKTHSQDVKFFFHRYLDTKFHEFKKVQEEIKEELGIKHSVFEPPIALGPCMWRFNITMLLLTLIIWEFAITPFTGSLGALQHKTKNVKRCTVLTWWKGW